MITRMSSLFLRTLREDPADAEVPSHKLLVRAGYVRRVAPGGYTWLPLGLRVLRNIETVVREEMDAIGAQEIQFPALLPREPYEKTGRWTEYGDGLFRLKDRKGADYLLGPTHEELFALTVKGEYSSYKDYPVVLYQIQTKYRDEARPRAGILRGREFVMKDSYSFDLDDEGLSRSYQLHRDAYIKIFDRLGLEYVIVAATSGAMGGSASEEFLAVAETGEDTYVRSTGSGYAANVEAVVTPPPPARSLEGLPEAQVHHTPGTPTIATLVEYLNTKTDLGRTFTAADTLKNVMVKTRQPGAKEWEILGIGIPGDREVDQKRLEASLEPAQVALLEEADFAANPFLVKGYIGPKALQDNGIRYLVDPRVVTGTAWVTGADKADHHVVDLVAGRDFTPDGTIEAAEVREGDASPDGQGTLVAARGIEIGHIFQLGRKYTDAFEVDALGADSKPIRITMGSYGVGVSRLVGAIAEQHHDELGLVWPRAVAPADVHVVIAGKDESVFAGAEQLAAELDAAGVRVLLDDRKATPGVKFADAELIGVPTILVVGRGLAKGVVEVKDRATGDREDVPVDEVVARLVKLVRG
ncbi:prolyl-tRNA synthetase [Amycolatopsis bartoniae]|uniref:Proline--tRNA ligase n=1 Tax=Amycolatopsis bartoniae TaxID=941986 RepID=A0A8H9IZF4_9PSEU|nr:proline--tRNA ligase [Amycolatopsis bartoniae]MBB2934174.1 prolyl-tRNA synthetase [Amycolatopsis bartoniae]TVT08713.1 proline--tRNA ligase [Amycolatopsis bartoniae]GHF88699.1 proline--tRNA ligase [Amycolatopsis bartoniae]